MSIRTLTAAAALALTLAGCSTGGDIDSLDVAAFYSFEPNPALRGDTITIVGMGLAKVTSVVFPDNLAVSQFHTHTATTIAVTVPEGAAEGKIILNHPAGQLVSEEEITYLEPVTVVSVTPTQVDPGDVITITGQYLSHVTKATFAGAATVEAGDFISQSADELLITVPIEALSGAITLTADDGSSTLCPAQITVSQASYDGIDKDVAEDGQTITIYGENLHLVCSVTYPGGTADDGFSLDDDGTRLYTTVPLDTYSGPITLTQYSGLTLTTDQFTFPSIAYSGVDPADNVAIGDTVTISGVRLDKVIELLLPDGQSLTSGQFSADATGSALTFAAPEGMTDGSVTMVQNAFISARTDKITMAEDTPGNWTTVWEGSHTFGGSWDTRVEVDADLLAGLGQEGEASFSYSLTSGQTLWRLRPMDGTWTDLSYNATADPLYKQISLEQGSTEITIPLSADDVTAIKASGMTVFGSWITLTAIAVR